MIETIERMLTDLERGKLTRRQFAVSVATLAAASLAGPDVLAAPPAPAGFRAVSVNHVTVKVPHLQRTSRFYQEFFGMPLRQQSPTTHILGWEILSSTLSKAIIKLLSITMTSGLRTSTPTRSALGWRSSI
jgi:hypothetical protein